MLPRRAGKANWQEVTDLGPAGDADIFGVDLEDSTTRLAAHDV